MSIQYAGLGGSQKQGFYFQIEGLEEVQNRVDLLADFLTQDASVGMMNEVGENVAGWMRENVLENFVWRTGALYKSIDYAVLSNDAGDVSLFAGPNDQSLPYTAIHEFGGSIYPGSKGYLMFEGEKGWRRIVKRRKDGTPGNPDHVVIPARPYIRPAFTEHENEITTIMEDYLYESIASGAASI